MIRGVLLFLSLLLLCEVMKAAERLRKNHPGSSVEVTLEVVRAEVVRRLWEAKPMAGEGRRNGKLFSLPIWATEEACGGRNGEGEGGLGPGEEFRDSLQAPSSCAPLLQAWSCSFSAFEKQDGTWNSKEEELLLKKFTFWEENINRAGQKSTQALLFWSQRG